MKSYYDRLTNETVGLQKGCQKIADWEGGGAQIWNFYAEVRENLTLWKIGKLKREIW
jgi:hypothetical protein